MHKNPWKKIIHWDCRNGWSAPGCPRFKRLLVFSMFSFSRGKLRNLLTRKWTVYQHFLCVYGCVCLCVWLFLFNLEFTDFYNVCSSLEVTLRHNLESHWLCVFCSMRKSCILLYPRESLWKWKSFPSASGFPLFMVFLKASVHRRGDNNLTE
jgi:hypothetical protein